MAFLISGRSRMGTLSTWMSQHTTRGSTETSNETFVVGEVDDDSKRLIRTTLEASQMPLLTGTCGPGKQSMRPARVS